MEWLDLPFTVTVNTLIGELTDYFTYGIRMTLLAPYHLLKKCNVTFKCNQFLLLRGFYQVYISCVQ